MKKTLIATVAMTTLAGLALVSAPVYAETQAEVAQQTMQHADKAQQEVQQLQAEDQEIAQQQVEMVRQAAQQLAEQSKQAK